MAHHSLLGRLDGWLRRYWLLVVAGLVLLCLLLICVLWLPRTLYPPLSERALRDVTDLAKRYEIQTARLKLQNDARMTLLQGLGALLVLAGAGIGAGVTLRQVRINQQQLLETRKQIQQTFESSNRQIAISEQGQITDRFTKAIEQLGNDKRDVRIGAIFALEALAKTPGMDADVIIDMLCAYVREHSPWPPRDDALDKTSQSFSSFAELRKFPPLHVRRAGVAIALGVLKRIGPDGREGLNLSSTDLRRSDLKNYGFERANLWESNLAGADLTGANLRRAVLAGAILEWAILAKADLKDTRIGKTWHNSRLRNAAMDDSTAWPKDFDPIEAGVISVQELRRQAGLSQ